jgi:3-keto-5-aminohexanoate cleavage enzyme
MMRPVTIAVAITGSVPRKRDNPSLPVLPVEQIESTHAAYEAGAALVHIHVRNDDESASSDPDRFAEVQAGVRKHCPGLIVQFSTGGRGRDPAARGLSLVHRPDMASLSTGSTNFPTIVYENPAALVLDLATQMKRFEIAPEIEIFDLSHIHGAERLIDAGLMSSSLWVSKTHPRLTSICSTFSWARSGGSSPTRHGAPPALVANNPG